jgi:hypothetical protein
LTGALPYTNTLDTPGGNVGAEPANRVALWGDDVDAFFSGRTLRKNPVACHLERASWRVSRFTLVQHGCLLSVQKPTAEGIGRAKHVRAH